MLLSALTACQRPPDRARTAPPPDVVLITIDTLRADRVGVTGGARGVTPALDDVGRLGAVFLDATAHAPLTLPSHASILTGRYPTRHGIRDNAGFTLSASVPTLASVLRSAGYHTSAFVSSFVVRSSTGLGQGFESYDDRFEGVGRAHVTLSSLERRGPEVGRDAARWLAAAPHPYFLWVHLYDPHAPYDPPAAFRARFPERPYDGEVAASDFGVATLLGAIPAERRAGTLIVATGDHGESLGEHGESEHGILLYDSTLHVPLILQGPGVPAGVTIRRQVRHVDLMPTILDLAHVKPPAGLDGISLVPLLTTGDGSRTTGDGSSTTRDGSRTTGDGSRTTGDGSRTTGDGSSTTRDGSPTLSYAESYFGARHFGWAPLRSARDGEWKYIDAPAPELYRLTEDPGERTNRQASRSETAHGLARALDAIAARADAPAAAAPRNPDVAERLRSLGYVSSRVTLGSDSAGADPKHEIARYESYVERFNQGLRQVETRRYHEAEKTFRALAVEFPRAFEVHQYLARMLEMHDADAAALAEIDLAIALAPGEAALYFDAARILQGADRIDAALGRVAEGRRIEPSSFYGALTEGLLTAARDPVRAERAFREAVTLNPSLAIAHYHLGLLAERRGDRDAAQHEYRLALDGDPTLIEARERLVGSPK